MSRLGRHLGVLLWTKLGSCPYCIRKAFQAAAGVWALALLFFALNWSSLLPMVAIIALGLTALWLAHLVTYACKIVVGRKHSETAADISNAQMITSSRRDLFPLFARALGAAVFTSAMTPSAFAAGWGACGRAPCNNCARPYYDNSGGSPLCYACHSCAINGCRGTANC